MISASQTDLNADQIRAIFQRHPGELRKIAQSLQMPQSRISDWFGRRGASRQIEAAIRTRAAELLAAERESAA